jgi:hypothetical protein
MFILRSIFAKSEPAIILGRWALHKKQHIIDLKIDYSNEDHCGVCSALVQKEKYSVHDENDDDWVYMAGTVME